MSRPFELIDRKTGDVTFAGIAVARGRRCPICGKPDWCLRDHARGLTICPRTPSDRQIGDAGYLHSDNGTIDTRAVAAYMSKPKPRPIPDFRTLATRCYVENGGMTQHLAESLGVSRESMQRLRCGWHDAHSAWTFPMIDSQLRTVGIRLRGMDGSKWAVPGSHNALFVPHDLTYYGPLCIEEGPTSTAAVLDWGFDCIGRPSCSACVDMTLEWVLQHGNGARRDIVIIRNKDEAKHRADGSVFYPGQEGGAKLADRLVGYVRSVKVIEPLKGKDSRQWKAEGGTRKALDWVIDAAPYWRAK